jgi:predicted ABC-type exoprotein transport system permease subunit
MIDDKITNTSELAGLEVAKLILSRIMKNQYSTEKMGEELDGNEILVLKIIGGFTDTGRIRKNVKGRYAITTKCNHVID